MAPIALASSIKRTLMYVSNVFVFIVLREENRDINVWKQYSARTKALLNSSLPPRIVTTILRSFAKEKLRDKELLDMIAETIPSTIHVYSPKELSDLLTSYSILQHRNTLIFSLCTRHIARKLVEFTPKQLSEVIYSYAHLGYDHPMLFKAMRRRTFAVARHLEPKQLALCLSAFVQMRSKDTKLLALLAAETCRRSEQFPANTLALVANSFAKLNVENKLLLDVIATELFNKRRELSPKASALVMNAYARLGIVHVPLFDMMESELVKSKGKEYSLQSVCMIAAACTRLGRKSPILLETLAERAAALSAELTPLSASSLVFSFAHANYRHGPLLMHLPLHTIRFADMYSPDQLAMVAQSFATLHVDHSALFDAIFEQLPRFIYHETQLHPDAQHAASNIMLNRDTDQYSAQDNKTNDEDPSLTDFRQIADESRDLLPREAEDERLMHKLEARAALLESPTLPLPSNYPIGAALPPANSPCRAVSLVWLLQSMLKLNAYRRDAADTLVNELARRGAELSPDMIAHSLHCLSLMQFAHEGLILAARDSLTNPERAATWDEPALALAANSLIKLGVNVASLMHEGIVTFLHAENKTTNSEAAEMASKSTARDVLLTFIEAKDTRNKHEFDFPAVSSLYDLESEERKLMQSRLDDFEDFLKTKKDLLNVSPSNSQTISTTRDEQQELESFKNTDRTEDDDGDYENADFSIREKKAMLSRLSPSSMLPGRRRKS